MSIETKFNEVMQKHDVPIRFIPGNDTFQEKVIEVLDLLLTHASVTTVNEARVRGIADSDLIALHEVESFIDEVR